MCQGIEWREFIRRAATVHQIKGVQTLKGFAGRRNPFRVKGALGVMIPRVLVPRTLG